MSEAVEVEVKVEGRFRTFLRYSWNQVKDTCKRLFTRKNIAQATYFVGSVALTYVVMQFFLPLWLNMMILSVAGIHEMTHYITARNRGQDPWLPFFVPWVYGITAATYVDKQDPLEGQQIALAGPLVGILVSFAWGVGSALLGFTPGIYAALWMGAQQLFSGTFGSDGRKYRKYGKQVIVETEAVAVPAPA